MSEKSAFRPCERGLVELFKSTLWALNVQVKPDTVHFSSTVSDLFVK
jgi:hypothetical protein